MNVYLVQHGKAEDDVLTSRGLSEVREVAMFMRPNISVDSIVHSVKRRAKDISKACGNVCYCPECRNPLNDGYCKENIIQGRYDYICGWCRRKSTFAFDLAPVPILIENE